MRRCHRDNTDPAVRNLITVDQLDCRGNVMGDSGQLEGSPGLLKHSLSTSRRHSRMRFFSG